MPDRRRPTIDVFRHHETYIACFSDAAVAAAFGVDTVPTAFTRDADPLAVLRHTARDNPQAVVRLVAASPATERYTVDPGRFRNGHGPN